MVHLFRQACDGYSLLLDGHTARSLKKLALRFRIYDCRHTFATRLGKSGADAFTICKHLRKRPGFLMPGLLTFKRFGLNGTDRSRTDDLLRVNPVPLGYCYPLKSVDWYLLFVESFA